MTQRLINKSWCGLVSREEMQAFSDELSAQFGMASGNAIAHQESGR